MPIDPAQYKTPLFDKGSLGIKTNSMIEPTPPAEPRSWRVAFVYSLILPGLGQGYNGQLKKGIIFYFISVALLSAMALSVIATPFKFAFILSVIAYLSAYLYIAIDAALTSWKVGVNYQSPGYSALMVYILIGVGFGCWTAYHSFLLINVMQAFKLPSGTMEPTLLIGDRIIVDKFSASSKNPLRGDIIVFKYGPEDAEKIFIKRAVGIPGDVIKGVNKQIFLNGKLLEETYIVHKDDDILTEAKSTRDNFGPVTVPSNSYFVMGDNRDKSYDSRFWGFVDCSKIIGKAKVIYWSWDSENMRVRWDRIGKIIRYEH
jgi:signal peptidase I